MRLKTKLVLAVTTLVFAISGMLSMVFVSQLLRSAAQQSFDTNLMVANQVRFALQNALLTNCATWRPRRCATMRSCRR